MQLRIAAVACQAHPDLDDDWLLLQAALAERGVGARTAVWTDPELDWASFELVVVRGTWDYVGRVDEFRAWGWRVGAATRLVNPASVLVWNSDKRYLIDLAAADVPVVATNWVAPGERWQRPDREFVVKPSVSAGGFETARYRSDDIDQADRHIRRLHETGQTAMVQPYIESVDREGEVALVYFGGRFSHAVSKGPLLQAGAGVRGHLWEDERIAPIEASTTQRRVADHALEAVAAVSEAVGYARVDLFNGPDGRPLVSEVELIEPALFLRYADGAVARFADALVALL